MEHDHTPIGWKAWVADLDGEEVVYSSEIIAWDDLPNDGVQIVMIYERQLVNLSGRHYRVILSASSYFQYDLPSGVKMYNANEDTKSEINARYPGALIKRGKMIHPNDFERISHLAMADHAAPKGCIGCNG